VNDVVVCPNCRSRLSIPEGPRPETVRCPSCGTNIALGLAEKGTAPGANAGRDGEQVIAFSCPHCGNPIKAPPALAGKAGACNKCRQPVTIPQLKGAATRAPDAQAKQTAAAPAAPRATVPKKLYQVEITRDDGEELRYKCPRCNQKLESPSSSRGTQDTCPICKTVYYIPEKMISYQCDHCGATLESPYSMGGKQEKCPLCSGTCEVPLTKEQQAALKKRQHQEHQRRKEEQKREKKLQAEKRAAEAAARKADEAVRNAAEASDDASTLPASASVPIEADEAVHPARPAPAPVETDIPSPISPPSDVPEAPRQFVSPEAQEVATFASPDQRCVLAGDLAPDSLAEAASWSITEHAKASLEFSRGILRVLPMPVSKARLSIWLGIIPIQCVLLLLRLFVEVFEGFMALFVFLGSLFGVVTGNVYNVYGSFWNMGASAWNILLCVIRGFQLIILWFRVLAAIIGKSDLLYIPAGIKQQDNGSLASLTPEAISQVFHISVSRAQLSKASKSGSRGCLGMLFALALLPITILRRIAAMFMGTKREDFIALVTGPPIDFEEPKGILGRFKKRRAEKKARKRRAVVILRVLPEDADAVKAAVGSYLGKDVELIDDDTAGETIWR
jgi:hypothetical protein